MRNSLLFILFIIISLVYVQSINGQSLKKDTVQGLISAKGKLPVYELDSCIANLFETIVEVDKQSSYYCGIEMFYSLVINRSENHIDLVVWPDRWEKSAYFDYFGVLKIGNATFLCRGDYRSDTIFHKSENEPEYITLRRPIKITTLDEFDKAVDVLVHSPSLYGTYIECSDLKIVTSIYIEKKLPGFEIDKKKSTKKSY